MLGRDIDIFEKDYPFWVVFFYFDTIINIIYIIKKMNLYTVPKQNYLRIR